MIIITIDLIRAEYHTLLIHLSLDYQYSIQYQ